MRKTVCVDFDGVLNTYDGWQGEEALFEPRPGASDFLFALFQQGCRVVVFTTRPADRVWQWLRYYEIDGLVDDITDHKPPATAYIDDRAIRFDGDFAATLAEFSGFKAHWER